MIELFNEDCMKGMKRYPDKYFDLAIVDPPYGIGASKGTSAAYSKAIKCKGKEYHSQQITGDWDNNRPDGAYFSELFRISKNQIIWGGNYFIDYLSPTPCVIVWDKQNGNSWFADGEMAWGSFKTKMRIFKYLSCGFFGDNVNRDKRFHPTQKPVKLYEWLIKNYAKEGDKILDTHGGSMSIAIACYNSDFDLTLFEIDKAYFDAGKTRLENHKQQGRLFDGERR